MKKTILSLILVVLSSSVFFACGKQEEPVADVDTPVTEEPTENSATVMVEETSEEVEVEEETADNSWAEAYLSIITEWHVLQEDDSAEGYSLIYLNDDDIPELCLFCTCDEGVGTSIYTYIDDEAVSVKKYDFEGKQYDRQSIFSGVLSCEYAERTGVFFGSGEIGFGEYSEDGYFLKGDSLEEVYFQEHVLKESDYGDSDDEIGENWEYIIKLKGKDGNTILDKIEDVYYASDSSKTDPREDFGESNEYYSEFLKEYNINSSDMKIVDGDEYYKYDEIAKKLRQLCPIVIDDMTDFSWLNSYIDYLKSVDEEEYATAAVVYVDDDNIPEIALAGTGHYLGSLALTIGKDNTVKDHQFGNNYIYYMPRKDIMYNYNSGAGSVEDDISCINDGDWKTLFLGSYDNSNTAPVTEETLYTDFRIFEKGSFEEGEGRSVSEKEYYDTMDAVFKERGYDEDVAKEVAFSYTLDDLIKELKQILAEKTGEEYEEAEPWKAVYRDKLYDIYNGTEILNDCSLADSPGDNGNVVFCLIDIVDDETPELLASRKWPEGNLENPDWNIYQYDGDKCSNIGRMTFYDTDNRKFYSYEGGSSDEEFFSYTLTGGIETRDVGIMHDDYDGYDRYTLKTYDGNDCIEQEVSENEWNSFMSAYKNGIEKYGIKGIELTKENIKKELGE